MADILAFDPSPSHRLRGGPLPLPQGERVKRVTSPPNHMEGGDGTKVTSPSKRIEGGEVGAQHRVRVERHGGNVHRGVSFAGAPMETTSQMHPPSDLFGKPEDGVINWVHHQTPPAIVRFNRTIHAAVQMVPPVKPEGLRFFHSPLSLRLDRRAHGTLGSAQTAQTAQTAHTAQPHSAVSRKPLFFIHNLKSHRKTGE